MLARPSDLQPALVRGLWSRGSQLRLLACGSGGTVSSPRSQCGHVAASSGASGGGGDGASSRSAPDTECITRNMAGTSLGLGSLS